MLGFRPGPLASSLVALPWRCGSRNDGPEHRRSAPLDADSEFEAPIFADGFESGDTSGWDSVVDGIWRPQPGPLAVAAQRDLDTSYDVQMYDIDLFEAPGPTIAALRAAGRAVVCYFSAGSWEEWRPTPATICRSCSATSSTAGRGSAGSTSVSSTCSARSSPPAWTWRPPGLHRRRSRQRRRLPERQRLPPHRRRSARLQSLAGDGGPRARPLGRAQERPRPDSRPGRRLRLGARRAVLAVQRVRGARALRERRQGGLRGRIHRRSGGVLPAAQCPGLLLAEEGADLGAWRIDCHDIAAAW